MKPSLRMLARLLVFVVPLWAAGPSDVPLVKTKLTDEVTMELPADFLPVAEQDRYNRSASHRPPERMFTDPTGRVDFSYNTTQNFQWREQDLAILQSFYRSTILTLYTEVEFLREERPRIDGRPYIVFEFVSTLTEGSGELGGRRPISKYNYVQYTLHEDWILVFSFSAPADRRAYWQPLAGRFMNTVRVR
ncbi:MAG: hypothetical protein WBA12_12735 [Catalinimonas sp.]